MKKVSPVKRATPSCALEHAEITRHGISHAHALRLHRRLSALINIITRRVVLRSNYKPRCVHAQMKVSEISTHGRKNMSRVTFKKVINTLFLNE